MSAKSEQLEQKLEESEDEVCASCGIAAVDNIKLKLCDGGCDIAKYCGDGCQENHREQHEDECKERLAEMHDKKLFKQPDISHLGECSICCLPLPLDPSKSILMGCCCKIICKGCNYANTKREEEAGLEQRCAFCREPAPESHEEHNKRKMERVKKNDPVAMTQVGKQKEEEGDFVKALEYYAKAAELGDANALACLGDLYHEGKGVEKDMKRGVYLFEQAAIGGHPSVRGILAIHELNNGRSERAAKHYTIAANLGQDLALKAIKHLFVKGIVSKEDYAAALRGHQAAVDATKSAEREAAEAFRKAREAARRN
jgi:tetratricopeptide (TPR) repeat protein